MSVFGFIDNPLSFKNIFSLTKRTHSNDKANLPTIILHLFSFQTPILIGKKIKKSAKSIVGISPTMVLLFLLLFLFLKK